VTMNSTSSLKDDFDRDGFVHVRGFLSPSDLRERLANLERYKQDVAPTLPANRVLYDRKGDEKFLKQLVDMQDADEFFMRWLKSDSNSQLARELLGEEAAPQTLEYFEKAPRQGTPTPPHQDGYYFCLKPNLALTMWVALDDCDDVNGCLSYVRGSHRHGIINHESSNVTGFSQGLPGSHLDRRDSVAMHVSAGDCLIHHCATIHFAGPNRSDRWRRSFGLVFYAANAERDSVAWERYLASVERQRLQAATAR
jgi:phytanoyl-CoA hydroxylase